MVLSICSSVLITYWPDWHSSSSMLSGMSGHSTAVPFKPFGPGQQRLISVGQSGCGDVFVSSQVLQFSCTFMKANNPTKTLTYIAL